MAPPFLPYPLLAGGFDFALRQSTVPGLLIVVALLLVSSLSWAIMITKYRAIQRASLASRAFLEAWKQSSMPLELHVLGRRFEDSPHYRMYHEASRCLTEQLVGEGEVDDSLPGRLLEAGRVTPAEMETVQLVMQKAMGEAAAKLESQTPLLATAVSGGPFLGLLGTVWGVMDTFSGIAASASTASLKDMAPGVAAALVTTVVGLLVAIPASFGYNFLVNRIRTFIAEMDYFSAELAVAFNRTWLEVGHGSMRPLSLRPAVIASLARPQVVAPVALEPEEIPVTPVAPAQRERVRRADPEDGFSEDT